MIFEIEFTNEAVSDIEKLQKAGEKKALDKMYDLLEELKKHPYTGTGHPKALCGNLSGQWSRRISGKHRLVYTVEDDKLMVLILSTSSHYGDK